METTSIIDPGWQLFNAVLGATATVGMLGVFYLTPLRNSRIWTITVTPLASIIGSGFLVVAPLLYLNFGRLHLPAIIGINVFAICVGLVMRQNIKYFEPRQASGAASRAELLLDRLANLALGLSYVISVAFYINLLSSFALDIVHLDSALAIKLLTTVVLAFIGIIGYLRGLHGLEALEKVAVNVKLSVIGALLLVLISTTIFIYTNDVTRPQYGLPADGWEALRVLGGMLLIVQGFETVRYLGRDYDGEERIRGMLIAQVVAAVIYILFVPLAAPLSHGMTTTDETAIVEIIGRAALGLGLMLSIAAIFSQFGAAVADTVGTGGILEEETQGRMRRRIAYVLVCALAILLVWLSDVFSILTLASRAFALYYGLQAVVAALTARAQPEAGRRAFKVAAFSALALILFWIAAYSIPAHV